MATPTTQPTTSHFGYLEEDLKTAMRGLQEALNNKQYGPAAAYYYELYNIYQLMGESAHKYRKQILKLYASLSELHFDMQQH